MWSSTCGSAGCRTSCRADTTRRPAPGRRAARPSSRRGAAPTRHGGPDGAMRRWSTRLPGMTGRVGGPPPGRRTARPSSRRGRRSYKAWRPGWGDAAPDAWHGRTRRRPAPGRRTARPSSRRGAAPTRHGGPDGAMRHPMPGMAGRAGGPPRAEGQRGLHRGGAPRLQGMAARMGRCGTRCPAWPGAQEARPRAEGRRGLHRGGGAAPTRGLPQCPPDLAHFSLSEQRSGMDCHAYGSQ